jgi:hypothetical protein
MIVRMWWLLHVIGSWHHQGSTTHTHFAKKYGEGQDLSNKWSRNTLSAVASGGIKM